jgi:hypothetical protein
MITQKPSGSTPACGGRISLGFGIPGTRELTCRVAGGDLTLGRVVAAPRGCRGALVDDAMGGGAGTRGVLLAGERALVRMDWVCEDLDNVMDSSVVRRLHMTVSNDESIRTCQYISDLRMKKGYQIRSRRQAGRADLECDHFWGQRE